MSAVGPAIETMPTWATEELGRKLDELRPTLAAVARSMQIDSGEVDDLVQTTLLKALAAIDQLRDPSLLRAWLIKIELREAYRLSRRLRRLRAELAHAGDEHADAVPTDMVRDAVIREALERLPRRRRACVVLHVMAGFSVADTAEALDISPNTVKTQVRAGLTALRKDLADELA